MQRFCSKNSSRLIAPQQMVAMPASSDNFVFLGQTLEFYKELVAGTKRVIEESVDSIEVLCPLLLGVLNRMDYAGNIFDLNGLPYGYNQSSVHDRERCQPLLKSIESLVKIPVKQVSDLANFRRAQVTCFQVSQKCEAANQRPIFSGEIAVTLVLHTRQQAAHSISGGGYRVGLSPCAGQSELVFSHLELKELFMSQLLALIDNPGLDDRERRCSNCQNTGEKRLKIINYVSPRIATMLILHGSGFTKKNWQEKTREQDDGRLDTLNETLKPIKATNERMNQLLVETAGKQ